MSQILIRYLNGPDVESLDMTNVEILQAVERSLLEQGKGNTVIEPRAHLIADPGFDMNCTKDF